MPEFAIKMQMRTASTVLDSMKITGALISRLILRGVDADEVRRACEDGSLIASSPFPMGPKDEILLPISNLLMYIRADVSEEEFRDLMRNRKGLPRYLPLERIREIMKNDVEINLGDLEEIRQASKNNESESKAKGMVVEPFVYYGNKIYANETKVFARHFAFYARDGKFWVHIRTKWEDETEIALQDLEKEGLSGRRSAGYGRFTFEKFEDHLQTGVSGNAYYMSLSLFVPAEGELRMIDFERSYYRTRIISGLNGDGSSFGFVRPITEGSLLFLKGPVNGKTIPIGGGRVKRLLPFNLMALEVRR
ncbi:hypothetical protein DMB44_08560 [Thermoplasma sp. Kam2015]|uniref:type III-A CRISPR-associated RAMP protein Csm4 n=1 Tax=Thermoplasma sp. Kam2015 TaxID=2094122 RepID=UPI000D879D98|nr:hypothetical protein [Thermoplasma sp. Kam2015]PYB67575.1 hypothetical protein DMB44_08560 [Thermoplasma sp. Kam2015]